MSAQTSVPILELRGITKRFGDTLANDGIDLSVDAGEIRAVVGENGAGKSTLMSILYGMYRPDSGEIFVGGVKRTFRSPVDAIAAGMGMVHQHFMLFPSMTVAENIVYGAEPTALGVFDHRAANDRVAQMSDRYGLEVDPRARVADLTVGVRQRVEILKMLHRGADILILDEPTSVLTPLERDALFRVIKLLADDGKTVLFITHKLPEVFALSDSITVLRDGRVQSSVSTSDATPETLARDIVGSDLGSAPRPEAAIPGYRVLDVEHLVVRDEFGRNVVDDVSLTVRRGEILGIAGAAGSGQRELVEAIAGDRRVHSGRIAMADTEMANAPVASKRKAGLSYIPGERDDVGLAVEASVTDNLLLGSESKPGFSPRGLIRPGKALAHAARLIEDYDIKVASQRQTPAQLSGGNRQKLVVARELHLAQRLIIAEEPTRGLDIRSTEFIRGKLLEQKSYAGILLVSADLGELLKLADRIIVMFEGRIAGELVAGSAGESEIGALMTGVASASAGGGAADD